MPYVRVSISLHPDRDADVIALVERTKNVSRLFRDLARRYMAPDPALPVQRDEPVGAIPALDEILESYEINNR